MRNLLCDMSCNPDTTEAMAEFIQNSFDKISASILCELLINLVNKDYKFWDTAEAIASY